MKSITRQWLFFAHHHVQSGYTPWVPAKPNSKVRAIQVFAKNVSRCLHVIPGEHLKSRNKGQQIKTKTIVWAMCVCVHVTLAEILNMYVSEKTTQHRAHAVCVSSLQSRCLLFQFDKIRSKQVTTKSPMNHRGSPAHKNTSQRHRPQLAGKNLSQTAPLPSQALPTTWSAGDWSRGSRRWRVELR